MIKIYTDGSSLWNPGPGGRGVLIQWAEAKDISLVWWEEWTTNNRMELTSVMEALNWLLKKKLAGEQITVYLDSLYVHDWIQKYLANWIARGWKLANKSPVLNQDLWKQVPSLVGGFTNIQWVWVKWHAYNKNNNLVDGLARSEAERIQKSLPKWYKPPVKASEPEGKQKTLFN